MRHASTRAWVNFVVDTVIAVAFVLSAISGLVFLVPSGWLTLPDGATTSALGIEYGTWRTLHDWTAVIMIAGVVLHTALHWRWIMTMIRRMAGGERRRARPTLAPAASRASARTAVQALPERADAAPCEPGVRDGLTRHAFLKGAGVVGAAVVVGGLVGRAAASAAVSWLQEGSSQDASSSVSSATEDPSRGWSWGDGSGSSGGSEAQGADSSAQSGAAAARVTIDAGRCTGCGACLQACPFGVLAASSGTVVVADAAACRLCGHCTQVCRPGAIALNG